MDLCVKRLFFFWSAAGRNSFMDCCGQHPRVDFNVEARHTLTAHLETTASSKCEGFFFPPRESKVAPLKKIILEKKIRLYLMWLRIHEPNRIHGLSLNILCEPERRPPPPPARGASSRPGSLGEPSARGSSQRTKKNKGGENPGDSRITIINIRGNEEGWEWQKLHGGLEKFSLCSKRKKIRKKERNLRSRWLWQTNCAHWLRVNLSEKRRGRRRRRGGVGEPVERWGGTSDVPLSPNTRAPSSSGDGITRCQATEPAHWPPQAVQGQHMSYCILRAHLRLQY